MASKIYNQLFERMIQQFVGTFSEDSNTIFKDEREKLIHPGEYGRYREDSCKNILRLLLDKHVCISDGFVISSKDTVTTQCDIIVYNSDAAPIIADGFAKMFPSEEVRMIGEVKSNLSKSAFIKALRKMANNKQIIIEGRGGSHIKPNGRTADTYNTVASFLICNKWEFNLDDIVFSEVYQGIDRKYWHNALLSIENGASLYAYMFSDFPERVIDNLQKNGINTEIPIAWQYPVFSQDGMTVEARLNHISVSKTDKYKHISKFFSGIAACCKDVWIYSHDPAEYLGMTIDTIFQTKQ